MMKHYTLSFRRYATALVLAVLAVITASAGDTKYYYFYATAKANPTGVGKVYLSQTPIDEAPSYEDEIELMFTSYGSNSADAFGYAEPAEGYLLAGWSTGTDAVEIYGNPGRLPLVSSTSTEEGQEPDEFGYPFEPDAVWNALFTRVMVSYVPGQEQLGDIACSKVCNEIGDEVLLTATPASEDVKFVGWTLNGEKFTDNPLKVTVTGTANYVAHFESSNALNIIFPEEGGYIPFSSAYSVYVPEGVVEHTVVCDSLEANPINYDKVVTFESGYMLNGGDAALFYGAGEYTFVMEEPDEWSRVNESNLLKSAGADGVDIATLPQEGYRYFIFDENKFVHTADAVLKPYDIYLAVPDSCGTTAEVLTIVPGSEDADGIEEVVADKAQQSKLEGIYDLSGRRVALPGKDGIYIIDGKKVLFRKK